MELIQRPETDSEYVLDLKTLEKLMSSMVNYLVSNGFNIINKRGDLFTYQARLKNETHTNVLKLDFDIHRFLHINLERRMPRKSTVSELIEQLNPPHTQFYKVIIDTYSYSFAIIEGNNISQNIDTRTFDDEANLYLALAASLEIGLQQIVIGYKTIR